MNESENDRKKPSRWEEEGGSEDSALGVEGARETEEDDGMTREWRKEEECVSEDDDDDESDDHAHWALTTSRDAS